MRIAIGAMAGLALLATPTMTQAQSYGFATYSAFVLANGTTNRGSGVSASSNVGTGQYLVTFSRPVDTCVANVSFNGNTLGTTTSVFKNGDPNSISVFTFNNTGAPANRPFQMIVVCAS